MSLFSELNIIVDNREAHRDKLKVKHKQRWIFKQHYKIWIYFMYVYEYTYMIYILTPTHSLHECENNSLGDKNQHHVWIWHMYEHIFCVSCDVELTLHYSRSHLCPAVIFVVSGFFRYKFILFR